MPKMATVAPSIFLHSPINLVGQVRLSLRSELAKDIVFIFSKLTGSSEHLSQPSISLASELRWPGVEGAQVFPALLLSVYMECVRRASCLVEFKLTLWSHRFLLDVGGAGCPPVALQLHHP